jgi:hypothetical protein
MPQTCEIPHGGRHAQIPDITGQRFGRLTVINSPADYATQSPPAARLRPKNKAQQSSKSGNTQSCGCLNRERVRDSTKSKTSDNLVVQRIKLGPICTNVKKTPNHHSLKITVVVELKFASAGKFLKIFKDMYFATR